jgi:hypothetical protein
VTELRDERASAWVPEQPYAVQVLPLRASPPRLKSNRRWVQVVGSLAVPALLALGIKTGAFQQHPRVAYQGPTVGYQEAAHPLGVPEAVVIPSSSYSFLMTQKDGTKPVTWSPCRPIHYVVRPGGAPPGGDALIAGAFKRLSATTGFRFVNDGATDEVPRFDRNPYQPARYGDHWAPVLITWARLPAAGSLGLQVAGEAAPIPVRTRSGDEAYVSGVVALDVQSMNISVARYGESAARMIVMHELGHLMGLGHVEDASQIMSPMASPLVSEYQAGDRAGLNLLSTGPCQPDV